MWSCSHNFHGGRGAWRCNHIQPSLNCPAPFHLLADPGNAQVFSWSLGRIRRAAEDALLVFIDIDRKGLIAFAANYLLPALKIEPLLPTPVLPSNGSARAAIFNEEIASVGVHVGNAPCVLVR